MNPASPEVTDAPREKRYEAHVDGKLAGIATYIRTPELIAFLHTEVEPEYEGRGVGSAIARAALDEARANGERSELGVPPAEGWGRVLAACPFIAGWIAHHPDYQDLEYQPRSTVSD